MSLGRPLCGIVTPLITPLATPESLDTKSLEKLLNHVIEGGVSAVFILGTTGEGPALPTGVRREMVEATCRLVDSRVPVLVGVTDSSLKDLLDLSDYSAKCGAEAIVTAGPTYFPVAQPELQNYIEQVAARSPLPIFLYNMPSHTHLRFSVETVVKAAALPGVIGLKDSSGELNYLHAVKHALRDRPDFTLLVGPEEIMGEAVLLTTNGGVNGGSNLFPRVYVQMYEAARDGDAARMRKLNERIIDISRRIYCAGTYGSSYLRGLKCAAAQLGLCKNVVSTPYTAFEGAEVEAIRQHLRELGELPLQAG
ncbi:MAG: dihydrodipicolinate synthase family protein [Bryobacterales bacterium]|nr:dihydrodipicolinate synthase family protein [Bryobacterales bacterium]